MSMPDDAPDTTRRPLTRDSILSAALELVDTEGLDALTMRALGARLGVEAMSIYHHLPSKQAVIDGIVDLVWAEVTLTGETRDWRKAVRRTARSAFTTLLRHPWANRIRATSGGPARMAYIDASLGHLRRAGFTPEQAFRLVETAIVATAWRVRLALIIMRLGAEVLLALSSCWSILMVM